MRSFVFHTPTKILFGKGMESNVGECVKSEGASKVLIVYGGGSVIRSGLLDRVYSSLDTAGIKHVSLGGVVPNPRLSKVYEGIELGKAENVDFLLGVGGGSVVDTAKAISYGLANDRDVWDYFSTSAQPEKTFPVGCIMTLPATGTEMSDASVITNEDGWLKRGCNSPLGRPKFSIMNPELTMSLPDYQTASGVVDILMHTMERFFSHGDGMELTDSIAEALLRTVIHYGHILKEDPSNYEARAEIMWAGSLAHNGLTECGSSGGDWAPHMIEHELGGMFDVAHGAGLAAIWPSWARYVYTANPKRFERFATNVLGVKSAGDANATALLGIEAMEEFYRSINMPTNMRELGIEPTDAQINELAKKCTDNGRKTVGGFLKLGLEDVATIYRMAK